MECQYYDECINNTQCYRCSRYSLLRRGKPPRFLSRGPRKSAPGRRLEHAVAREVRNLYSSVRQQPASGAKWHSPGDVIAPDLLVECKSHTVSAVGSRQHTITRGQLEKIAQEAALTGRLPLYTFQFRGDDRIYAVMDIELLEELFSRLANRPV